jgi:hypothetical protein
VKRCPRCGEIKPYLEFHRSRLRRDGVQSICKSCRADIDHERYERRWGGTRARRRLWERGRRDWLLSLKTGQPCTDCARFFPPQVLQWDHLPGHPKLGDVSTLYRLSRQEVLEEIAKCELVCANCHAIRTFERAGWPLSWTELGVELAPLNSMRSRVALGDLGLNLSAASLVARGSDKKPEDPTLMHCAMCGLWQPRSEFPDSKAGQFSYCRPCRRAYDRNYHRQRGRAPRLRRQRARVMAARAWMASLKDGIACTDCHEVFPAWVMHWDHLPGYEKVGCISELVGSRRRAIILEELRKCELVCTNCHVLRTIGRATNGGALSEAARTTGAETDN